MHWESGFALVTCGHEVGAGLAVYQTRAVLGVSYPVQVRVNPQFFEPISCDGFSLNEIEELTEQYRQN
jgi:hypothetical protein